MQPSGFLQGLGNLSVAIAAVVYAMPLQLLLLELSRKRDDGGAGIAGLILLVPMWLLLMVGLLCVTATGGFNWIRASRTSVYLFIIPATLAMAIVSTSLRFEMPRAASGLSRLIGVVPIQLFTLATILVVVISLNPRLAQGRPLQLIQVPWGILAATSLALCLGFAGFKLVANGTRQVAQVAAMFRGNSALYQETLARIPTLDPQRDFSDLIRFVTFDNRSVREAALESIGRNPTLVDNIIGALNDGSVASDVPNALRVLEFRPFTAEEQVRLAAAARSGMSRITRAERDRVRYMGALQRRGLRRWGERLFTAVAAQLAAGGVDFAPTIEAYSRTFDGSADGDN